jgi:predicted N-acetyltransferase YhbS
LRINVRNIEPKDYRRLEEIAREAFWNLYFPGCDEHYVIHKMVKHGDYIKELSFLIEIDGNIVGGIFYTRSKILTEDKKLYETVTFGPVFIDPRYHRKGLGRELITHSIEKARGKGYLAILILGYPYHYETYGFLGGKKYGICMEDGKFYKGLLVLPLSDSSLKDIQGKAIFSEVFETDEKEVELFDKTFIPKEKKVTESQTEFEIASTMLDD